MKKKTNNAMKVYLDFHIKCMASGELPSDGLCNSFEDDDFFELFKPTYNVSSV